MIYACDDIVAAVGLPASVRCLCRLMQSENMKNSQSWCGSVDTFGTGNVCADDCLELAIPLVFGLMQIRDCRS